MKAAQQKAKAYYDKTSRVRTFSVHDKVMLLRPSKRNKLEVQWEGPAEVVEKLSGTNYAVKTGSRRNNVKIYHSNLMKPYVERQAIVNLSLNVPEEMPVDIPSLDDGQDDGLIERSEAITQEGLEPGQIQDMRAITREFQSLFSERPGKTSLVTHDIELTSYVPIKSKPYRVSPRQREIMETEIKKMLELGVIEAAESDDASPMIFVEVPGKDPRPCIDYRKLNAVTMDQIYLIPNIEERVETVSKAKYIPTLDLVRGYWQVLLSERASRYAAFTSPIGTFRTLMLSFGLKNAPYCFSGLMDRVRRGLGSFALP